MPTPGTLSRVRRDERAVSPVIGVILMVAITVILAAVIGAFVLDLGQTGANTAPAASLTVEATTGLHHVNVSHRGGDSLPAERTRVIITNESSGDSASYDSGGSSGDVLSVGGEVGFNTSAGSTTWSLQPDGTTYELSRGVDYTIAFVDTETERVIYETTVTAQ